MPEETLTFRRAVPQDAEGVLSFWAQAGASPTATADAGTVRSLVLNPCAALVLAESGGQIVGTLIGTFDGWRGNMYRLAVRPDRRRQGIATALVREVERVFLAWGVARVNVLVELDRPWAVSFWTAVGYPRDERVGRHHGTMTQDGTGSPRARSGPAST